jgi:Fe2+ transport system protein FeoA
MDQKLLCLVDLKEGQKGIITTVLGGRGAIKKLADLGLTPNTEIEILKKIPYRGPIEIQARGSNLVLGRGIASKVMVEPK